MFFLQNEKRLVAQNWGGGKVTSALVIYLSEYISSSITTYINLKEKFGKASVRRG